MVRMSLSEGLGMVTVTEVDVAPDLKNAVVYISCLKKEYQQEVMSMLSKKTKDFQHILGRKLEIKYTPKLVFRIDKGLGEINRVEEILNNLKQK